MISRSDARSGGRATRRYFATLQGLVLSRSSSRAFRRNVGNFCQDRGHVIPRSSHATRARQVARANARTHDMFARTHARTHEGWYTRAVSRDTRERPCIYFAYIRHGFEHGHTEHNLGESINDRRCEREEKEWGMRRGEREEGGGGGGGGGGEWRASRG